MSKNWSDWINSFPAQIFEPQSIIIAPDSVPREVVAITSGLVKMFYDDADGNRVALSLFSENAIVPIPFVLLQKINPYTFMAMTKVEGHVIPADQLQDKFNTDPEFTSDMFFRFLRGFGVLTEQVTALKLNHADEKIKIVLKQLIGKAKKNEAYASLNRLTQQEIADLAGVSRETVSRRLPHLLKQM